MNQLQPQIVKSMERGQVTIPLQMRKKLKITPQTWMWVKLVEGNKIVLQPVEKQIKDDKRMQLSEFLKKNRGNKKIYWNKEDDENLEKVNKLTRKRLKENSW